MSNSVHCACWRLITVRFLLLFTLSLVVTIGYVQPVLSAERTWPDTSNGIHVFNDQLSTGISDAQIRFAATNYAGTQKLTRSFANRLRAVNANFMILHYRLGLGLGYRGTSNGCNPNGDQIRVIEGDSWVVEFPDSPDSDWFFQWSGQPRVLNCSWGWYLADLDSPEWRTYWSAEVSRQLAANDNDGVFMDSLSIPNYLGGQNEYSPQLPYNGGDPATLVFEQQWQDKIESWLQWLQGQTVGESYLIPNVGSWVTSRDRVDYSAADGVMVEGFAIGDDQSPYNVEDWRLQSNRILDLVSRGKAFIGQTYIGGVQERMFTVGTYLLLKGNRSYINIDRGLDPEWWPEYDIKIGTPLESAGSQIGTLDIDAGGVGSGSVYRRRFTNGIVLVNPTSPYDGSGQTRTVVLDKAYYLVEASGGGDVGADGEKTGALSYRSVSSVELGPYSAAVLVESPSGECGRCDNPGGGEGTDTGGDAGSGDGNGGPPDGATRPGDGPKCKPSVKLLSSRKTLRRLLIRGMAKVRLISGCSQKTRLALRVRVAGHKRVIKLRPLKLSEGKMTVTLETRKKPKRSIARRARDIKLFVVNVEN